MATWAASAWFGSDQSWEPAVAFLGTLATLLAIVIREIKYVFHNGFQILSGYAPTMSKISKLIARSERSVWLFRAHTGEGQREASFYSDLDARLAGSKPLEEVRRNVVLHNSESLASHLKELIDKYSAHDSVTVATRSSDGPRISFMIVDKSNAVIGFPNTDGTGISLSIYTNNKLVVDALCNTYNLLWEDSDKLFKGTTEITQKAKKELKAVAEKRISDST